MTLRSRTWSDVNFFTVDPRVLQRKRLQKLVKEGNWEKALEMEANSIQPDVVACSAVMRAFK
ncbi:hypothetical protein V2J09_013805 [Rumex salicifolius]